MKVDNSFKIRSIVLATALSAGLSFVSPIFAQDHAVLVDLSSKKITDLGINTFASAINDKGQVAGISNTVGLNRAFITGPNGVGVTDLGTLGGNESGANGINDIGQVVGSSKTTTGARHAFITGPNGAGMTDLGTLRGYFSEAQGINDMGQVVGDSDFYAFIIRANGAGMTDLGTLGGIPNSASGINNTGQVVGSAEATLGAQHAFITGPNGTGMIDLGSLGGTRSFAYGINDAGQVVGESATSASGDPTNHAFVTGPNGVGMTDLNSLLNLSNGPIFTSAVDINNHGQVIGVIPEPASYILMLAGLALVGFMMRCKKHVEREAGRLAAA
jgi:probable HAF family extracellular repeat protein